MVESRLGKMGCFWISEIGEDNVEQKHVSRDLQTVDNGSSDTRVNYVAVAAICKHNIT